MFRDDLCFQVKKKDSDFLVDKISADSYALTKTLCHFP